MTRHSVGSTGRPERPVWLVQVRGTRPFSCECNVFPSRSGDKTANYMLVIVDGSALRMIAGGDLYAEQQPIETLGRDLDLHT
jgi:hypothetical protein